VPFTGVTRTSDTGAYSQFGQTDETGKYVVRGLPAGNFSVCFDAGSDGRVRLPARVLRQ